MKTLPDKPSSKSVSYALSQLEGAEIYIEHVKSFIKMQELELKQYRKKSTGILKTITTDLYPIQQDHKNLNTDASKNSSTTTKNDNYRAQTVSILVTRVLCFGLFGVI